MPQIVTIRAVVDNDKVQDFIDEAQACLKSSAIDFVAETHVMPNFLNDQYVMGGFKSGDFNRQMHVGNKIKDAAGKEQFFWYHTGIEDGDPLAKYKYDTLPSKTESPVGTPVVAFVPE